MRRILAVLALVLLVLASQAAAGDGEGKKRHKHGGDAEDREDDRREADDREAAHRDGEAKGPRERHERDKARGSGADDAARGTRNVGETAVRRPSGGGGPSRPATEQVGPSLRIHSAMAPGQVHYTFVVSAGTDAMEAKGFGATLPDFGSDWTLGGAGAGSCDLFGMDLACDVGPLAAGEAMLVQASAPLASPPGWEPQVLATFGGVDQAPPADGSARMGVFLLG